MYISFNLTYNSKLKKTFKKKKTSHSREWIWITVKESYYNDHFIQIISLKSFLEGKIGHEMKH